MGATTGFLVTRGLASDGAGRSQAYFLQERSPALIASVLLPTIDYVTINETRETIELVGRLGRASSAPPVPGSDSEHAA